jgi:ABC-2 type transport system permease protein
MRILIRAELDKLRTLRSTWIVVALSALSSPAIAAVVLLTIKHLRAAPTQIAGDAFGLSGVTIGILCASAFAAEYQDRTIATTFTLVPARAKVLLAKALAAVTIATLAVAVMSAACYTLAAVWLDSSSVAWPWNSADLLQAVAGNLVLGATVALVGVAIGGITQRPPLAGTAMGLVWFGLSNLLATFLAFFRHYGIVAAQTALTQPTGHHDYSFTGALAAMLALTALMLLAALERVKLTDIR